MSSATQTKRWREKEKENSLLSPNARKLDMQQAPIRDHGDE